MQKWCTEDWQFELIVTRGKAGHCRLGLEKGDKFVFSYGCSCKTQAFTHRRIPRILS